MAFIIKAFREAFLFEVGIMLGVLLGSTVSTLVSIAILK